MWARSATARASDSASGSGRGAPLTRRALLSAAARGALLLPAAPLLGALAPRAARATGEAEEGKSAEALPDPLLEALRTSPLVYVSPLLADGSESTCHGEVWFAWLDGAVHLTTGRERWKARALRRGLDRARLWVGDFGVWKQWIGTNEGFRKAPRVDAKVERVEDEAVVERLLATYAEKYPEEFPDWRERMRRGHETGERVLLRYSPIPETVTVPG